MINIGFKRIVLLLCLCSCADSGDHSQSPEIARESRRLYYTLANKIFIFKSAVSEDGIDIFQEKYSCMKDDTFKFRAWPRDQVVRIRQGFLKCTTQAIDSINFEWSYTTGKTQINLGLPLYLNTTKSSGYQKVVFHNIQIPEKNYYEINDESGALILSIAINSESWEHITIIPIN